MSASVRRREAARRRTRRTAAAVGVGAAVIVGAVAGAIVLATGGGDDRGRESVASAGGTVPDDAIETLDGGSFSLADFRGRPAVVNFFASWCVPCLAEMPGFERVHQDLGDQVTFVGLNLQDTTEAGASVVERTGVTYTIGRDPNGTLFQTLGAFAMPTTVFVDAEGRIVDMQPGEISATELEDRIREVLMP